MLIIVYLALLGLVMGSFLGVLIDRLPEGETLGGRSHCDYCKKTLRPLDMIPVFSYLWMKGKTSCCGKPLTPFYPFIEVFTSVSYVLTYMWLVNQQGGGLGVEQLTAVQVSIAQVIIYIAIVSALIVILFADLKFHIIPDEMNVLLLVAAFALQWTNAVGLYGHLEYALAGLILSGGLLLLFIATKGKGLGFGDVKFAFVMGFLLGLFNGFAALYIAFILGGIFSTYLLISKKAKAKTKIAFGPFLIVGTVVMLFYFREVTALLGQFFN